MTLSILETFRTWRKRRAQRLSYRNENIELRAFMRVQGVRQEALTELVVMKQEKITRLQEAIRRMHGPIPHRSDMRAEVSIQSAEQWARSYSRDFDDRQKEYEETGRPNRQERVTTRPPESE